MAEQFEFKAEDDELNDIHVLQEDIGNHYISVSVSDAGSRAFIKLSVSDIVPLMGALLSMKVAHEQIAGCRAHTPSGT